MIGDFSHVQFSHEWSDPVDYALVMNAHNQFCRTEPSRKEMFQGLQSDFGKGFALLKAFLEGKAEINRKNDYLLYYFDCPDQFTSDVERLNRWEGALSGEDWMWIQNTKELVEKYSSLYKEATNGK